MATTKKASPRRDRKPDKAQARQRKPRDCSRDHTSCPRNEGHGCECTPRSRPAEPGRDSWTASGKPKPTPWIVNLGDLTDPPFPEGTPIDVIRRDGRREDGLPCGNGWTCTHACFLPPEQDGYQSPSDIVLYRLHDPSDPAPRPRAMAKPTDASMPPQVAAAAHEIEVPLEKQRDQVFKIEVPMVPATPSPRKPVDTAGTFAPRTTEQIEARAAAFGRRAALMGAPYETPIPDAALQAAHDDDGPAAYRRLTRVLLGILLALALIVGAVGIARGAVVGNIPTEGDGNIRLLNDPCPTLEGWALAYMVAGTGKVISACWMVDTFENKIAVKFADGDLYLYPTFQPIRRQEDPQL